MTEVVRKPCDVCGRETMDKDGRSFLGLKWTFVNEDGNEWFFELYPELVKDTYAVCPVCLLRGCGVRFDT